MITELTQEQIDKFPEYAKKWTDIGLCTKAIDKEKASKAIDQVYKCAGMKPPEIKIFLDSPFEGVNLSAFFVNRVAQVWNQVRDQVRCQVRAACYGNQDYRLSFYDYFIGSTNISLEKCSGLIEASKECGWFWPFENAVIITAKPLFIKMDDNGRLNCENGAAIQYPDGFSVYSWHGTRIPKEWIEDKHSLTAKIALTWKNIEQRRCACEIIGWNNILNELDAKTINADRDPEIGELVEVNIPDIGKEKFLRVKCGTGRDFAIPVPPYMKTALQANAWTWQLEDFEYNPEVRT